MVKKQNDVAACLRLGSCAPQSPSCGSYLACGSARLPVRQKFSPGWAAFSEKVGCKKTRLDCVRQLKIDNVYVVPLNPLIGTCRIAKDPCRNQSDIAQSVAMLGQLSVLVRLSGFPQKLGGEGRLFAAS